MNNVTKMVFLLELRQQCDYVIRSYSEMLQALDRKNDTGSVFFYAQSFLVSSANISKILRPSGARGSKEFKHLCHSRGRELRALLGIDDSAPILNHDVRDSFEHIDERVQCWSLGPGSHIFVSDNVIWGVPFEQGISASQLTEQSNFRALLGPPPVVSFWQHSFALDPIMLAVQEIKQRIDGLVSEKETTATVTLSTEALEG